MAVVVKNPVIVVKGGGTDYLGLRLSQSEDYSYEDNDITTMPRSAFAYDARLRSISSSSVTTVDTDSFTSCTALLSVNFPQLTNIRSNSFFYCASLTSITVQNVTSIGMSAFANCTSLTSISFPNATSAGTSAFQTCSALTTISFAKLRTIPNGCFISCDALTSLTLGRSTICTLNSTNAFTTKVKPTVYVPYSLIGSYQTATNWSTLYNNSQITFAPISGTIATISTTVINGSYSGATSIIAPNTTTTVTLSANSGYQLPSSITVTNASYTYDSTAGVVSLSNIIGNVTISATCTAASQGYTLTVAWGGDYMGGYNATIWIKTNSAPTSDNDRTVGANGSGLVGSDGYLISSPKTYNDVTKVYVWVNGSTNSYVEIGDQQYGLNAGYANATEITLSADTTIETYAEIED